MSNKIIDTGTWTIYEPDLPANDERVQHRVIFYQNERGEDWYETIAHHPDTPKNYAIGCDPATLKVVFVSGEPDMMEPSSKRVFILEGKGKTSDLIPLMGQVFDPKTGKFTPDATPRPEPPFVRLERELEKEKREKQALAADVDNLKNAVRVLLEREAARGKPV